MILKLMAEQKATATFLALSCAGCVQTGSGNTTSLRALAETFVERERFVGVCYRATNVFGKGGSEKRVRSVRDGPGDAMIRRIITQFFCRAIIKFCNKQSLLRSLTNYLQGIDCRVI